MGGTTPMIPAALAAALAGLLLACGGAPPAKSSSPAPAAANCVATFLAQAERQSETDEQRAEIAHALEDMLTKSPQELKSVRYADYQGKKDVWTARELLEHYFLSPAAAVLNDECFYRDAAAPEARAAVQKRLDDLKKGQ